MLVRTTLCALTLVMACPAQTITERYPRFGTAAAAGDINNDGVPDLVFPGRFVHVISGRDGALLVSIPGSLSAPRAPLDDDIDGDGVRDLLLADDVVWVYSGRTGAPLRRHAATVPAGRPTGYNGVGDIDGDGVNDYGMVFPEREPSTPTGSHEVVMISGASGAEIRRWSVTGGYTSVFGVHGMGDLDGNGTNDWAVFAPAVFALYTPPFTYVFSGGTQAPLPGYRFTADWDLVPLRSDVDGDGCADYVQLYVSRITVNSAVLYSGRTGTLIAGWDGVDPVAPVGDWDGDGVTDLAMYSFATRRVVEVVSLPSGRVIFGFSPGPEAVESLVDLGDRDDDGGREIAMSVRGVATLIVDPGGADFTGDPAYLDPRVGGTQQLNLTAPATYGGQTYWILGSLSGTTPGVPLGVGTLPLVPDAYTVVTASFPVGALLQSGTGVLGAGGSAQSALALPPLPAATGLTLHHAYLVLGSTGVDYVSRAAPLALPQR